MMIEFCVSLSGQLSSDFLQVQVSESTRIQTSESVAFTDASITFKTLFVVQEPSITLSLYGQEFRYGQAPDSPTLIGDATIQLSDLVMGKRIPFASHVHLTIIHASECLVKSLGKSYRLESVQNQGVSIYTSHSPLLIWKDFANGICDGLENFLHSRIDMLAEDYTQVYHSCNGDSSSHRGVYQILRDRQIKLCQIRLDSFPRYRDSILENETMMVRLRHMAYSNSSGTHHLPDLITITPQMDPHILQDTFIDSHLGNIPTAARIQQVFSSIGIRIHELKLSEYVYELGLISDSLTRTASACISYNESVVRVKRIVQKAASVISKVHSDIKLIVGSVSKAAGIFTGILEELDGHVDTIQNSYVPKLMLAQRPSTLGRTKTFDQVVSDVNCAVSRTLLLLEAIISSNSNSQDLLLSRPWFAHLLFQHKCWDFLSLFASLLWRSLSIYDTPEKQGVFTNHVWPYFMQVGWIIPVYGDHHPIATSSMTQLSQLCLEFGKRLYFSVHNVIDKSGLDLSFQGSSMTLSLPISQDFYQILAPFKFTGKCQVIPILIVGSEPKQSSKSEPTWFGQQISFEKSPSSQIRELNARFYPTLETYIHNTRKRTMMNETSNNHLTSLLELLREYKECLKSSKESVGYNPIILMSRILSSLEGFISPTENLDSPFACCWLDYEGTSSSKAFNCIELDLLVSKLKIQT